MSTVFFTIDELLQATQGQLLLKQDSFVYGVSTDSRSIQKGELFIPLVGENFDGHSYLEEVAKKGAGAIFTQNKTQNLGVTTILVKDTLRALQDLASYHRSKLKAEVIAITGSNGKTTTKFFTENILSSKYKVYASKKSFNNHIGVPLTLLSMVPDLDFGILEVGMNHPGEISALTKLANPDISLVTTVGRAHLMDFGGIEGIAKEKGDIYRCSSNDTIRIFNLDNPHTLKLYEELKTHKSLTFSETNKAANVQFQFVKMTLTHLHLKGTIQDVPGEVVLPIFGRQNLTNLMGAASIALACGLSSAEIWKALPRCETVWGRNMLVDLPGDAKMIFDGYNANPDSMRAMVENLADIEVFGEKTLILGDMLELGDATVSMHKELGQLVGSKDFDNVIFVGQFADHFKSGIDASGFSKNLVISNAYEDSLAKRVAPMIQPHDVIVLKGSRGAKLERFVPHFMPLNWKANT